jgi:hypothetical protein
MCCGVKQLEHRYVLVTCGAMNEDLGQSQHSLGRATTVRDQRLVRKSRLLNDCSLLTIRTSSLQFHSTKETGEFKRRKRICKPTLTTF